MYIPHESLQVKWHPNENSFDLIVPWMDMTIDVDEKEKPWIQEATHSFQEQPALPSVQRFFEFFKDYIVAYRAPRSQEEFDGKDLQPCLDTLGHLDFTTPTSFLNSLGVPLSPSLENAIQPHWQWSLDTVLEKAKIPHTDLYDPLSVVSYLICYRLNWESTTWSGQDGLGQSLESLLQKDEEKFFRVMGWISRQSHYVTKQFHISVLPALEHFPKAEKEIQHFIQDEVGHYKFMEQTIKDLGFKGPEEFSLGEGTRWMLDAFEEMGRISPLAFSAMVNIFEAAYYEGQDPLSRVLKQSSRPQAAQGYDLHYKINKEHRHCDMPLIFSKHAAPQTKEHVELTVRLFEATLHFLDDMEEKLLAE